MCLYCLVEFVDEFLMVVVDLTCGVAVNKAKGNPALKVAGVTAFTFEELSRATNSFDEKNQIGQGGYGKVYVGDLKDGRQRVAIKRASRAPFKAPMSFTPRLSYSAVYIIATCVALWGTVTTWGSR